MPHSDTVKAVIEDQIATLNARAKQLRAKIEEGKELTDQERVELSATADRIQGLLRELKD